MPEIIQRVAHSDGLSARPASAEEENPDLVGALSCPDFYPHHPAHVEIRETHISLVFLAGDRAYKLKKPLVLPFLDYGTAERRRHMCNEELRLNRPLAKDIYLGVRSVSSGRNGLRLASEDDPEALDYLVEMRRYDERHTLAATLARVGPAPLREDVESLARMLALFHARARKVARERGGARAVRRRTQENLRELLDAVPASRAEGEAVRALQRFTRAFLAGHAAELDDRALAGRVVEGHGDLRAEHVVLDGHVRVVDCIEFDPRRRELDVADDLAFLAMDLSMRGAESLAWLLVDSYRRAGGDPGAEALMAFYACFRALVRVKVELLRASQIPAASGEWHDHCAAAQRLLALAERFAWRARLPSVLAICGAPATGKSTLATALSEASGLPYLSSDVVRKEVAGVALQERAPLSAYSAEANRHTYTELGRRTAHAIASGRGAIVDATFRHRADRAAFLDALREDVPRVSPLFVECVAPLEVTAARARRRETEPGAVSDASEDVVLRERDSWEPLDEVPQGAHTILDSDRLVERQLAELRDRLDSRLAAMRPPAHGPGSPEPS